MTRCRVCGDDHERSSSCLPCPTCEACFECAQDDCATCLRRQKFLAEEAVLEFIAKVGA